MRLGVHGVEAGPGLRVPEPDAPVRRATPGGEAVLLPRAPREGLDGGLVSIEAMERLVADAVRGGGVSVVPDVEKVVVAATRKLRAGFS